MTPRPIYTTSVRRIYLDYAATTPVHASVKRAMEPFFAHTFGNPSSLHAAGQEASAAVFRARRAVAAHIGADWREVIFTGSATEANNLAIRGALRALGKSKINSNFQNQKFETVPWRRTLNAKRSTLNARIIVSAVEHDSVLGAAREMEAEGTELVVLPVSRVGLVDLKGLTASLNEHTVLVSVQYANSEVGTVQPIAEIAKLVRDFRNVANRQSQIAKRSALRALPLLHTDAAAALQFFDCNVDELGVDLMTLSAHKIYGPKGVGALYARRALSVERLALSEKEKILASLMSGGDQEFGVRAGTENVAAIVGFAAAVERLEQRREDDAKRVRGLATYLWKGIRRVWPGAHLHGLRLTSRERIPNIVSVGFRGADANELLARFDLLGLMASAGSACASRAASTSHVLMALGLAESRARETVRLSIGSPTTKREIESSLAVVKNVRKSIAQGA